MRPIRMLHLEDSARDAEVVRHRLEADGLVCDILVAATREGFEGVLAREPFDLIICDCDLPGYSGLAALAQAQASQPDVPVIIVSGTVVDDEAVECLRVGATDYLLKERLQRLGPAVRRALQEADTRRQRARTELTLRHHEQTLRENEERTSFALAAARMGVWEIDFTGNRLTWSPTMAPVFGLLPHQAPATPAAFFQLIHPDDRRATEAAVERAITERREFVVEFRAVWPDGSAHWVHGRAKASYAADGTPRRLLGIGMDIDERRSLEDRLRQAQQLEAIGRLAGGVAHDFNNVLTVILGFSESLLAGRSPDDPARADLLEITKAGKRAAGLTRQLLAFGRRQILQPIVLDLNVLIGGMEAMLRQLIAAHVELRITLAPQPALITMDPTQAEQILINLAVNAADAMPRGGTLMIETSNVALDGHVLLSVSDTGVGMDEATRRCIFEPFFTTKEVGAGTGLGLATVHGIVKQSGGDIDVSSEVGRGTAFRIHLPLAAPGASSARAIERSPQPGGAACVSETILLVEDDAGVRPLVRRILERLGYRVLEAADPKAAARLAGDETGPIHLLLSDVIMPESDGPPLFDRLVEARPGLRVMYMSGYTDEAVRQVLLVDGTPFLQKPFTPSVLAEKVRQVLDAAPSIAPMTPLLAGNAS